MNPQMHAPRLSQPQGAIDFPLEKRLCVLAVGLTAVAAGCVATDLVGALSTHTAAAD